MCVCTIFEINETPDGQLYMVMAHYEGETLKERIGRGPLVVDDAIDIATQVGQGLAEAHGAGIVHRDIKPANLLVTKTGVVKILDFGLAKLAGAEGMTQTGTTLGTVAYMSPEQLRGEDVDQRTDIWSLGVVLFEMVAGARPFKGERLEAVMGNILQSQPTSLAGSRTGIPADLERLVNRALVKPVADRYQTATDLLGELRTLQSSPTVTATQPDVPSIAVLPFVNMSADPEQEYFCDGLAEELIDALARLEGLRVVARTSAFRFKGDAPDLREVGEKLNVKTVLEGSVRKAGNRLRINAQLINTEDGYHLWSERYDRDMDNVYAVQDDIARTVVEKLKVKLLGATDAPLVKKPTDNVEAYNLVLQGRYYGLKFTGPMFDKALESFNQALSLEPAYAQAQAGIGVVHASRAAVGVAAPHTVMPLAREAAHKALALDESVADGHSALGCVLHYYDWDWEGAEREYRRAQELKPGGVSASEQYAILLAQRGQADASIAEARRSVRADPLSVSHRGALGVMLFLAQRFDAAIVEARGGIELDPNSYLTHMVLGWAFAALGKDQEAIEAFKQATSLAPSDPMPLGHLG